MIEDDRETVLDAFSKLRWASEDYESDGYGGIAQIFRETANRLQDLAERMELREAEREQARRDFAKACRGQ